MDTNLPSHNKTIIDQESKGHIAYDTIEKASIDDNNQPKSHNKSENIEEMGSVGDEKHEFE